MALYHPGLSEAIGVLMTADLDRLLDQIDSLFGRDNLQYGATLEEVRAEAIRQTREEFTDRSSPEYEKREFYVNLFKLQHRLGAEV